MAIPTPPVSPSESPTAVLTDAQKADAETFFEALDKEGDLAKRAWMSAQVPPALQELFNEKFPPPEPPAPPTEPPPASPPPTL